MQEQRPSSPPRRTRSAILSGLGIRPALVVGFALTIGIWTLAYFYFTRQIETLERRQTTLTADYAAAQDLLIVIRSEITASASATRNAILEQDADDVADYRRRIDAANAALERSLTSYATRVQDDPALDSSVQRTQVALLRHEIDEFRATVARLLDADHGGWPRNSSAIVTREMTPARDAAMSVAESVLRLNLQGFMDQQGSVAADHRAAQNDMLATLGVALLASLGVAVVLSRYAARLEARVRQQRLRDLDTAANLQRLTARLITEREEERRHIARELHDEVGQVLTVVKFALRDAQRALGQSGPSAAMLEDARGVADRALHTIRDLSRLLHPSLLDDMGLPVALDAHLEAFRKRHAIHLGADYENLDDRLSPDVELALYRIVQEALTNVSRHAQATACHIHVRRTESCVDVTIEDNGVGFDAVAASQPGPERGLGLLGMQERIEHLGGELVLESTPGHGTRVFASLPVAPAGTPAASDIVATGQPEESRA